VVDDRHKIDSVSRVRLARVTNLDGKRLSESNRSLARVEATAMGTETRKKRRGARMGAGPEILQTLEAVMAGVLACVAVSICVALAWSER
jgi:hypothetical protein